MTTEGVNPVENLNPYIRNEAETIAWSYGIKTEPCSQGGMNICNIDDGDYIKVCSVNFGEIGAGSFTANVSSVKEGGRIELHLDSPDGELIGIVRVPYTGNFDNWRSVDADITQVCGVHDLFFVFKGEEKSNLFKFDHWKFTRW